MPLNLEPQGARLIVEPEQAEQMTESGIYLPEVAQEANHRGQVVAIGPDYEGDINVGDTILYSKYGGIDLKDGDEDLLLIRADDILARVKTDGEPA